MSGLAGTGTLIRLALRRDRVRLPLWVLGIVGSVLAVARSLPDLYPTAAERQARAEFVASPTAKAFRGPGHGLDDYTIGAMLANELLLWALLAIALMSVMLVIRHTRAEEESGRAELVRSAVAGRGAHIAAAFTVVAGASVMIGVSAALTLQVVADAYGSAGSLAFGAGLAATGVVFAGVGAVAAQVSEHARGAAGIGAAALALAFVLRAVGDVGDGTASWLSPLGWSQGMRAFADERWWPLAPAGALTAVLLALAVALAGRRDVGAGLARPRPGPAMASRTLAHPLGLALRLQRSALVAWGAGLLLLGLAFGSLAGAVEDFLADSPQWEEALARVTGASLLDTFLAFAALLLALLASGCAVQAALRARAEETADRADALLATALPRVRWAGAHLLVALAGGGAVLLLGALGLGLAAAADQGEPALVGRVLGAGLAHVTAVWVVVGVVAALFGLAPRAAGIGWAALALAAFVGLLGDAVGLPDALRRLSPFEHVPPLPGADPAAAPLAGLLTAAALLVAAGLVGFRRRDVNVG